MTTLLRVARMLIFAIWFGGGLALAAVAAPAAFRGSPDSTSAASIVAIMLSRWHWIAISAPMILLLTGGRRSGRARSMALVLVTALALAFSQVGLDHSIHTLRSTSAISISLLSRTDPVRKKFGTLHGASSLAMALQILLAGVAIAIQVKEDRS